MFKKHLQNLFAFITIFLFAISSFAQQCPTVAKVDTKLQYGDDEYQNNILVKKAPLVKAWRYGNIATIVLVPGVNVNVDGSPRAYSVGNKGLADIQNGALILDNEHYLNYEAYKEKYGTGFADLWLEAERNDFKEGTRQFKAFALYSSDGESTIVGNGKGKPKTQPVDGELIKYYISMTSPKSQQEGFASSDQRRYFDSGAISAFVVPGTSNDPLTFLLAERQLAWAYYPDKNSSTFAIGGDSGPAKKFGEASIAFHQLLRFGKTLPIPKYRADGQYTKCSSNTPSETWSNCLYYPFYQYNYLNRTTNQRIKTDKIRVDNLKTTIFVFFNKDTKVEDAVVTHEIIQTKGKDKMISTFNSENELKACLKLKIPELANLIQ